MEVGDFLVLDISYLRHTFHCILDSLGMSYRFWITLKASVLAGLSWHHAPGATSLSPGRERGLVPHSASDTCWGGAHPYGQRWDLRLPSWPQLTPPWRGEGGAPCDPTVGWGGRVTADGGERQDPRKTPTDSWLRAEGKLLPPRGEESPSTPSQIPPW